MSLYDGSLWHTYISAEMSLALGTLIGSQCYDVFCYANSGTPTLEFLEWANATVTMTIATPCVVTWGSNPASNGMPVTLTTSGALPTGLTVGTTYWIVGTSGNTFNLAASPGGSAIATSGSQSGTHTIHCAQLRQTAIVSVAGIYCKLGATTRKYLGTFFTTSTTATEDSLVKRYVWNYYNRAIRTMRRVESTASWTYNSNTYRQANAAAANQLAFVVGLVEDSVSAQVNGAILGTTNAGGIVGVGLNTYLTNSGVSSMHDGVNSTYTPTVSTYDGYPALGANFLAWIEASSTTSTEFEGTHSINGISNAAGIIGRVLA